MSTIDHDKLREHIGVLRRISTTGVMEGEAFSDAVFFVTKALEATLPKIITKKTSTWLILCDDKPWGIRSSKEEAQQVVDSYVKVAPNHKYRIAFVSGEYSEYE